MIDRYALSPLKDIWSLQRTYEIWLEIEIAVLEAMEELGQIPRATAAKVRKTVTVDQRRIAEIEKTIGHDLLAFIRSIEEQAGKEGRYIHYGLTSSDVKDTALSIQIRDSIAIILEKTKGLQEIFTKKALQYKDQLIAGRTHGIHAEPTTLGLKFLLWREEIKRNIKRLEQAEQVITIGIFSGPVGTYSLLDREVEEIVCRRLKLNQAPVTSQIIQRDRHSEVMAAITISGTTLEKIATEIRHLSRTEINEMEEPTPEGSSSMPHKRNPIISERICGLARVLRGNLQAALENNILWHERDISHSSVERIIFPDSLALLDYMLAKMIGLIENLVVRPAQMRANLEMTRGAIFSHLLLLKLVDSGMARHSAYRIIARASESAAARQLPLIKVLQEEEEIATLLTGESISTAQLLDDIRQMSRRIIEEAT